MDHQHFNQSLSPQPNHLAIPNLGPGVALATALLLVSCGQPSDESGSSQQAIRRRAIATRAAKDLSPSQHQDARMARPAPPSSLPAVDYSPYKEIHPGMTLAEVQQKLYDFKSEASKSVRLMTSSPSSEPTGASQPEASQRKNSEREETVQWTWTHPSGVYNIHIQLQSDPTPQAQWPVQSKWLTYNPPS